MEQSLTYYELTLILMWESLLKSTLFSCAEIMEFLTTQGVVRDLIPNKF